VLPFAAGAALVPAVLGLQALWFNPSFVKGDHPAVMRRLAEAGRPGDAVFVNSEWQYYTFLHYYARAGLPYDTYLLPHEQAKPKEVIGAEAAAIYPRYQRIWLLIYGLQPEDPESRLERYLDEHLAKAENTWYGPIRLVLYAVPSLALADQPQRPLDVHFGDGIDLVGYSLSAEELSPGETLSLSLFWRARGPVGRDYTVFTHLLDAQERVVAQKDNPPRDGAAPTSRWRVGEILRDNYGLLVPESAAPGRYLLEVGLYLPASGERLALRGSGENRIILGTVTVRERG